MIYTMALAQLFRLIKNGAFVSWKENEESKKVVNLLPSETGTDSIQSFEKEKLIWQVFFSEFEFRHRMPCFWLVGSSMKQQLELKGKIGHESLNVTLSKICSSYTINNKSARSLKKTDCFINNITPNNTDIWLESYSDCITIQESKYNSYITATKGGGLILSKSGKINKVGLHYYHSFIDKYTHSLLPDSKHKKSIIPVFEFNEETAPKYCKITKNKNGSAPDKAIQLIF